VLEELAQYTLALPFNSVDAVEQTFAKYKGQIACIIVEPVVGNMGCVRPRPGYLEALREITRRDGAVLIFDEVMTGFRVAFGGAQESFGIQPDLTTLGKIIGGGLPVGAYGGREEIMNQVAPLGPMYQAGTLSGNPLAMAAGIAVLKRLKQDRARIYPQLEAHSSRLVEGVALAARDAGHAMFTAQVGAMFTWFFTGEPVEDWDGAAKCDTEAFAAFHRGMLERGVYLPPSQFEAAFLGTAHTEADVDFTVKAAREAFGR
jgi:glutamate-1-semialdehyde 2,1-aminomutase